MNQYCEKVWSDPDYDELNYHTEYDIDSLLQHRNIIYRTINPSGEREVIIQK